MTGERYRTAGHQLTGDNERSPDQENGFGSQHQDVSLSAGTSVPCFPEQIRSSGVGYGLEIGGHIDGSGASLL